MADPYRCQSMNAGMDGRPNQCALMPGHEGPHRNRSGRVKWTDDGRESVRLFGRVNDRAHRDFAANTTPKDGGSEQ